MRRFTTVRDRGRPRFGLKQIIDEGIVVGREHPEERDPANDSIGIYHRA
jgi:hypothetical protein